MSSVTKTLDLLRHFSATQPEIGLSMMCRLAKRDKATTYRHLQALENAGFVEQNPFTKLYRLGPALLQLGHMREATVPRKSGAEAALRQLSEATGETAHVSVLSGARLFALLAHEATRHSTRVVIDVQTFPLHATSSGLCALAFGPANLWEQAQDQLTRFTDATLTQPDALRAVVQQIRQQGFAQTTGSFEADVHSLSAPLFNELDQFAGAVSVAAVATRMTPQFNETIKPALFAASRQISHNWGGSVPDFLQQIWGHAPPSAHAMECAT